MNKNLDYEINVLKAFSEVYNKSGGRKFLLGDRRHEREDGTLTDESTCKVFSAELTEVADENIKKKTSYLIKKNGVGEAYEAYNADQVIKAIKKKEEKYSDLEDRILILDAFSCAPFSWDDYWQPVVYYGNNTKFAEIYAINMEGSFVTILQIK